MTLDEVQKRIRDELDVPKLPEYMTGVDYVLCVLAESLWAIEYGKEKEHMRPILFNILQNLPRSVYFQTSGGRYMEMYIRSLADSSKPCTAFLRYALPYAKQHARMLGFAEYAKTLNEAIKT